MAVEASLSNRRFLSSAYDDRAASDRVAMKGIASQTGHCSSESRPVIQAASGALPSSRTTPCHPVDLTANFDAAQGLPYERAHAHPSLQSET